MVTISSDAPVWTLDLGDDENRFSPDWLEAVGAALDEIEASTEPAVLVTIGGGKFYSNGLDLEWLGQNLDQHDAYVRRVEDLFARILTLPVPTVAAINGHAFGAGAMLAMAHDYRVMREDRGYFCFPEVDIHIPFTPGMNALVTSKLTPRTALDAMATGRRYGGGDAAAVGLVDAAAPSEKLAETAAGFVRDLAGKDRATLGTIKSRMFADVVSALRPADDTTGA
ncbi:enoyl-CoA hydratase/carnithine racemase [Nocardioides albertanoniae]|uniref:Enoyl-CoA hydratase/carnithine racemase n=1 Tax=Nocardioides albertanoniae TaxID=1175486 RepID=A0A543A1C5_9ACTN|nr:enoyl-CoA hydratase/isomerase family protein [Nocardioides albertanoniae]TQL66389.1 enoyl-CoA hydratase/carnithine racemase [Nocardioides albertanoniae]